MSYDVYLNDSKVGVPVQVERHEEGGTYALGGITEAELNMVIVYLTNPIIENYVLINMP
jgi:hypothetical protein